MSQESVVFYVISKDKNNVIRGVNPADKDFYFVDGKIEGAFFRFLDDATAKLFESKKSGYNIYKVNVSVENSELNSKPSSYYTVVETAEAALRGADFVDWVENKWNYLTEEEAIEKRNFELTQAPYCDYDYPHKLIVWAVNIEVVEVSKNPINKTGFKDKNGVDICLGDMLALDGYKPHPSTTCGIVTKHKGKYVNMYGQDALGRYCFDELEEIHTEFSVIENPE